MITMGCAGFPVPATRYFKEFLFVEVQETHVALPGTGTIRRWRREQALRKTLRNRPDLLDRVELTKEDKKILARISGAGHIQN